jgi:hypothetical protein
VANDRLAGPLRQAEADRIDSGSDSRKKVTDVQVPVRMEGEHLANRSPR